MDAFMEMAKKEGGDAGVAVLMYRSGYTISLVEKAKSVGVTFKDLEEIYGMFGPTSALVLSEFCGRIKT